MDFGKVFSTNKKAENEGSKVFIKDENGDDTDGYVIVARRTSQKYIDYFDELKRPHSKDIRKGTITMEKLTDLHRKAVAKHILLGWGNLNWHGEPFEYGEENAYRALCENDFFDFILSIADDRNYYTEDYIQETTKN